MRIALSFLAAILLPACLMTAWYLYGQFAMFDSGDPYIWIRTRRFLALCLFAAAAYVVVLGIPTYLVLRKLSAVYWWSTIGAGFIVGALPHAILEWPYDNLDTSVSIDGVYTEIHGIPTLAGWVQYASAAASMGACGVVGALAFWFVSRK